MQYNVNYLPQKDNFMVANREHKDRLFMFIFGCEENREYTLSLYNAINKSNYTDAEAIQFTTIKNILYLGIRNDVSFIISDQMNLFEHQSTFNPNMPVRLLQYVGHLYEQYIAQNKLNEFGKRLLSLPVPKLLVFYNGRDEKEDEQILKLTDSFPKNAVSDVEVKVRMLNINYGKNKALLDACKPLSEYAWFVEIVRQNQNQGMSLQEALNNAIAQMPTDFILYSFFKTHQAEVYGMLMDEYNEEKVMNKFYEDGREEGEKRGEKRGEIKTLISLVEDCDISIETAARKAGMTQSEFVNAMEQFKAESTEMPKQE